MEISDPLPGSKLGYKTLHELKADGEYIGRVEISYLTKKDVKLFKGLTKGKLKLSVGKPFKARLFVDAEKGRSAEELSERGMKAVVEALKERFRGLKSEDVYILELRRDEKAIIGRGDKFV